MKLYVVRHGEACEQADASGERQLTDRGQQDVANLGGFLKQHADPIETLYYSEKCRANQTAAAIQRDVQAPVFEPTPIALDGSASMADVIMLLQTWHSDTMLVGHLPFVAELVSQLVLARDDRFLVHFRPGTVVCLSGNSHEHWVIDWVLNPDIIASP